jgi:predicted RNA-binding protein with PIN domain
MPIIIDGYNLLWSIHKMDEDFEPISDVRLCQIVDRYLELSSERGEVVFDGTGPSDKSGFDSLSRLEVFFAGHNNDADTLIENKIKESTAPGRLTVVSSDRRVRKAARARKVTSVRSEIFWTNVLKQLDRKKTIKEPAAKRDGLSESETEQWLKFFGLEQ